jgi:anti-anti-sigma regulatory factor
LEPFQRAEDGPVTVVTFLERSLVDPDHVEAIRRSLDRLIDEGRRRLLFDMRNVEQVGSLLLGVFFELRKRLCAAPATVRRDLIPAAMGEPTGTPPQRVTCFEIYPDRESGVRGLGAAEWPGGSIPLCSVRPSLAEVFRLWAALEARACYEAGWGLS